MNDRLALIGLIALMPCLAMAAPPLIYEGTLTTGGQAPDPWPALRFSVVDADEVVIWSTTIDADGPIEIGPNGAFVAYLDDPALAAADIDQALRVEVCPSPGPDDLEDCAWLALDAPQRLGAAPVALTVDPSERARIRAETLDEIWQREDITVDQDNPDSADFSDIQAALASLADKRIPADTTVSIRVLASADPYPIDGTLRLSHPDGQRLRLVGETRGELDEVVIAFDDGHGLEVPPGMRFGLIDGVAIEGAGRNAGEDEDGVNIGMSAVLTLGSGVEVKHWSHRCLRVLGHLIAHDVLLSDCGVAATVTFNGIIEAERLQVTESGAGLRAGYGGGISGANMRLSTDPGPDFSVFAQGWLRIPNACQGSGECVLSLQTDGYAATQGANLRDVD